MTKKPKNYTVMIFIILFLVLIIWLYSWKNPSTNSENINCLKECVYESPNRRKTVLNSMGTALEVNFVENSASNCFNPFFPIIHIKTGAKHDAWIHIVRTDASEEYLKLFIDTAKEFAPFYNFQDTFYDSPIWKYGIFSKPLGFWEGHAYAVEVDHASKTVTCRGGVKWGFRLKYFYLRPQIINPSPLSLDDWQKDWEFFSKSLPGYASNSHIPSSS